MDSFGYRFFKALGLSAFLYLPVMQLQAADGGDVLKAKLTERLGGIGIDSVEPSPVSGLYEVMIGPRLFYVSDDGRYLISGNLKDLTTGVDLTEAKLSRARRKAVDEVGEANMLVFGKGDEKYTVDVFTDIDCGYCRKLHSQIDDYNKQGIRIRYLFYPRAGVNSESARKAESVWCADDRHKAMTEAKQGKPVVQRNCDNPVADQYYLGQLVGVRGTPALILEDGRMIPGYVPPARLRTRLDSMFGSSNP